MKLLQIINSLGPGGAEKLLVDTAIAFHKKGIEVSVLLLNDELTPLHKRLRAFKKIKIISIGYNINVYNPINCFKIKAIMKEFDVIHVHLFPSSYWVAFANLITIKKQNILFTEHNTTNRRRSKPFFKFFDKIVYSQFKHVITISDSVDLSLKKYLGFKFKNIIKIYNGIDLITINNAKPYTKEHLGFQKKNKILLQVASFTAQKDQTTLIKALKQLPEDYTLILVGIGPLLNKAEALVQELNLKSRVKFLGIRDDVPRLLKTVDVVVLSSHYEGLSLSCIEGLASGKPFIASNTPGLGDVVMNAGLLFEDKDVAGLVKIIKELVTDINYSNQTVLKCQNRAQDYDIQTMIDNYIKLYNNLEV